ncbi:O-antigen ligase family protein [Sphingomonas oryzagri]|uniref:O-antigen ligase family protein n=1 Tax=Sphingomonas oryzagri TaxID=3042314 RepID=A0ABT6MWC7_9SPHN|nr:O-antigen ligase family protein [Sphingomonas oryzagri]MDH7637280.1 O-antigen ligase family protein [Sphingomonas oryzagri]
MTFALTALLLLASGLLGGGVTAPNISMLVELIGCAVLGIAMIGIVDGKYPDHAKSALVFAACVALVPFIQLIPLPASIWRSLPGRAVPDTISQLIGQGDQARPIALDPEQAAMRGLALIVPIAAFVATLQLGTRKRDQLMMLVVGLAFCSLLLGVFQVATGRFYLFSFVHFGLPVGLFANRNHQADLLLLAIPMCARIAETLPFRHDRRRLILLCAVLFFTVGIIATQSRTALAILPVVIVVAFVIHSGNIASRTIWIGSATIGAVAVIAAALLIWTPIGAHALHRFQDVGEDLRPQLWRGTIAAAKSFWPVGSGVGSFVPVYDMFADLDSVNAAWVNHAHNDYLELFLETGVAGIVLIVAYAILLGLRVFPRLSGDAAQQRLVGFTGLAILLLHSITDYPMRTFILLAAFGQLNAMLFPARDARMRSRRKGPFKVSPQPDFLQEPQPATADAATR